MKYALICPNEPVKGGYRVAQVEDTTFPVAEPTYWLECSDNIVPESVYLDPVDRIIKPITVVPIRVD